jgi:hypothetical protein
LAHVILVMRILVIAKHVQIAIHVSHATLICMQLIPHYYANSAHHFFSIAKPAPLQQAVVHVLVILLFSITQLFNASNAIQLYLTVNDAQR